MRKHFYILITLSLFCLNAYTQTKEDALQGIREFYAAKSYNSLVVNEDSVRRFQSLLTDEGGFSDLKSLEDEIDKNHYANQIGKQFFISAVTKIALDRLWMIAETYRNKEQSVSDPKLRSLFQAIFRYGMLEDNRMNVSSRWHVSCFAAPVATTHIYFSLFDLMTRIESRQIKESLFTDGHKILGDVSLQSRTVPARLDKTGDQVVSVDRFRKHVWWVGGNATGYRPLLQTAAQLSSCEMADLVGEVAVRSISTVSQTTLQSDFWQEGFTADGAGWGHGMQCLIWGYPIDGTHGSLRILDIMRDYPLPVALQKEQMETLFDYLRGSSFYYYKGYVPPVVDRGNMNRLERPYPRRIGNKETDYRYGIPSVSCTDEASRQTPVVLSNTKSVQAAESHDGTKIGAVFYTIASEVKSTKGILKVSAPCVLLFEFAGNDVSLSVTDGLMDANVKEILIETSIPLKGINVNKISEGVYQVRVKMRPAVIRELQFI